MELFGTPGHLYKWPVVASGGQWWPVAGSGRQRAMWYFVCFGCQISTLSHCQWRSKGPFPGRSEQCMGSRELEKHLYWWQVVVSGGQCLPVVARVGWCVCMAFCMFWVPDFRFFPFVKMDSGALLGRSRPGMELFGKWPVVASGGQWWPVVGSGGQRAIWYFVCFGCQISTLSHCQRGVQGALPRAI